MSLPFKETLEDSVKIRTFSSNIPEEELKWHWDEKDRWVTPLEETDWQFQYDNRLPIPLHVNETIFIKANEMHRIIKGTTDLIVKIVEP